MRQQKFVLILTFLVCFSILALVACNWVDGLPDTTTTPQPGVSSSSNMTATFGADQFYIQLTAIAEKGQRSSTGGAAWP